MGHGDIKKKSNLVKTPAKASDFNLRKSISNAISSKENKDILK